MPIKQQNNQNDKNKIIEEIPGYKDLLNNPLWHLCRSNTENAMSNFWAYLIEQNGNDPSIILGQNKSHWQKKYGNLINILREKDHMDLQLQFDNGIIVLENKFKSLADSKQINDYKKKIENKNQANYHFFLVTPAGTKDFEAGNLTWLSYKDVKNNIKNKYEKQGSQDQIIKKYIELLESIVNLGKAKELKEYSLCQFWETNDLNKKELISTLIEDKLYAFVSKNLASKYQKKFTQKLPKDIQIEVGFTRSTPLIGWKKITGTKSEGIQIQNGQLRYFVMDESYGEISVNDLNKWLKNKAINTGISPSEKYCKFGTSFKYRYIMPKNEKELKEKLETVFNYWNKNN